VERARGEEADWTRPGVHDPPRPGRGGRGRAGLAAGRALEPDPAVLPVVGPEDGAGRGVRGMSRRRAGVASIVCALALAGCGGEGQSRRTTATTPRGRGPVATSTAPQASSPAPGTRTGPGANGTQPAPPPGRRPARRTPPPRAQIPESTPGGAGDEQPIRVPATFTLARGRFRPSEVSVPPFLAVQITVLSREPRFRRILLETLHPRGFVVPPGGRVTLRVPGQRAGRYRLSAPGSGAATLAVGSEPGP